MFLHYLWLFFPVAVVEDNIMVNCFCPCLSVVVFPLFSSSIKLYISPLHSICWHVFTSLMAVFMGPTEIVSPPSLERQELGSDFPFPFRFPLLFSLHSISFFLFPTLLFPLILISLSISIPLTLISFFLFPTLLFPLILISLSLSVPLTLISFFLFPTLLFPLILISLFLSVPLTLISFFLFPTLLFPLILISLFLSVSLTLIYFFPITLVSFLLCMPHFAFLSISHFAFSP